MAPMSQEQFLKAKLKMRDLHARIILRQLGQMHEKYVARQRMQRACKELRASQQLLHAVAADARALAPAGAERKARGTAHGTRARRSRSPAGRETTDRDQERLK